MSDTIEFIQMLQNHRNERHVVILHDFPDPDAISCAYAHRLISANFNIEVDILYSGEISHQQNIALVRLLGIQMQRYSPEVDLKRYQAAIFIDHQGGTVEEVVAAIEAAGVPVLMIIDHHQPQGRLVPEYEDIRGTGATATIYAGYLECGSLQLEPSRKEHVLAATALTHGILSDTQGFIRAEPEDLVAAAYLSRYRDAELLAQILNQARTKHSMDIIQRALGNREVIHNYSIAGIGYLRSEDRDSIPEAADFLMTEENVHTAIVYGIISDEKKGETLVGSMRTIKLTLDPDQFIKEVLGKNDEGRYLGGGRPLAGGFAIPIGFLSGNLNDEQQRLKWAVYDTQLKHKFYEKIGVERKSAEN